MKNDILMTNVQPSFFFEEKILSLMERPFPSVVCCSRYPAVEREGTIRPYTWRINLILSGRRKYLYSDGKRIVEHSFGPGEALLLPPGGSVWCEERGNYEMLSIVSSYTMARFVSKTRKRKDPVRYGPDLVFHGGACQKESLELLMRALASCTVNGGAADAVWHALLRECAFILNMPGNETAETSHYLLGGILSRIRNQLGARLSCDIVGEQFGVSGNYVAQIFARNMNCGFSEYLTNLRMEHACCLLEDSGMNVGAIAAVCGFRQTNYFIRVFRRRYGCTPLQYRIGFRFRKGEREGNMRNSKGTLCPAGETISDPQSGPPPRR